MWKSAADTSAFLTAPFWKIACNVEMLSLNLVGALPVHACIGVKEQYEGKFEWFEPPSELPTKNESIQALHHSVACRTIIAAARGGHLRHVIIGGHLEQPFAIRALLPHWIGVERWDLWGLVFSSWLDAASLLRRLLSHASLWLETSTAGPRYDRRLSRQEIQSLGLHFKLEGLPDLVRGTTSEREEKRANTCSHQYRSQEAVIESVGRYLPWLTEDAGLAQEVSVAWNAVVERGEADRLRCLCNRCREGI